MSRGTEVRIKTSGKGPKELNSKTISILTSWCKTYIYKANERQRNYPFHAEGSTMDAFSWQVLPNRLVTGIFCYVCSSISTAWFPTISELSVSLITEPKYVWRIIFLWERLRRTMVLWHFGKLVPEPKEINLSMFTSLLWKWLSTCTLSLHRLLSL